MQDLKTTLTKTIPEGKLSGEDLEALEACFQDALTAESNLLRHIMLEAAIRLRRNGPRHEIAQQLEDASDQNFLELSQQNVEIEVDDADLFPSSPHAENFQDPILTSLYHAVALRDGISALRIAGEEADPERHQEFQEALKDLKDTLNNHLKA